jgi:hypothetical protein
MDGCYAVVVFEVKVRVVIFYRYVPYLTGCFYLDYFYFRFLVS